MSYKITCYCTDETIQKISVYDPATGTTTSGTYGGALGENGEFCVPGLNSGGPVGITATPAPECAFYRWVYRIGDTDTVLKYSYEPTFTHTGSEDLFIRAEGVQNDTDDPMSRSVSLFSATSRPADFTWYNSKTEGGKYNLTAYEWNTLTARINAFREYRGYSDYNFKTATEGGEFTAGMYNSARIAIQGLGNGAGSYIPTVSSGQEISAYMLNIVVSELNVIQ